MSRFNLMTNLKVQAFHLTNSIMPLYQKFIHEHRIVDIQTVVVPSWTHPKEHAPSKVVTKESVQPIVHIEPPRVIAYVYYQELE